MFSEPEIKEIKNFIIKFLKLRVQDAPPEEFDQWRNEVRARFQARTSFVLEEISKLLKKHLLLNR